MPTINVVNLIASNDGYLTRTVTNDAEVEWDTYNYPIEQDYIKITNNGLDDLRVNIAGYSNLTIRPLQSWENNINFTQFSVLATKGSISFTAVTKEYKNTPLTETTLWQLMETRDLTETGDMILVAADATTSAGTINAAIAGVNKKFTRTVDVKLTNTAGTTHEWFYGMFGVTVAEGSAAGIVSIPSNYIVLNEGVGSIEITYTGTWAANDTVTLTIIGGKQFGYNVTNDTSVDTLAA